MSHFGKRVLGDKAWQAAQRADALQAAQGMKLGPRVTGGMEVQVDRPATATTAARRSAAPPGGTDKTSGPAAAGASAPPGSGDPPKTLSIVELQKALAERPPEALRDELLNAEYERPEGEPRKGALRLLLKAEQDAPEPRKPIITELTRAIHRRDEPSGAAVGGPVADAVGSGLSEAPDPAAD